MSSPVRRLTDAMLGAGSLCVVATGISIMSPDVRTYLANAAAGDLGSRVSAMTLDAQRFAYEIKGAVAGFRIADDPAVAFAIGALVLTVLMFRS